jgi:alpha-ribazole phosphatase
MSVTTRWWWVRHAPVINPERRIYGQSDLEADLSDGGRFGRLAATLPADAVWLTTRLRRARDTAARLAADIAPGKAVAEENALLEQAFGDWEGARWDDIPQGESDRYWRDPVGGRTPNGESFADVAARVAAAVERLTGDHGGRDIVAVAHAGSIRAAIGYALGGDPKSALSFHLSPLSLTRIDAIRRDGRTWWRVAGVNLLGDHE